MTVHKFKIDENISKCQADDYEQKDKEDSATYRRLMVDYELDGNKFTKQMTPHELEDIKSQGAKILREYDPGVQSEKKIEEHIA